MSSSAKKELLAHWLARHKAAVRGREQAKEALETWFKRARLALDEGEHELARAAKDKAVQAREAYRVATAEVVEIEEELARVRAEPAAPDNEAALRARLRAEHAAAEFRKLGIDPRFAALEEAGYGAGLDDLLGSPDGEDATGGVGTGDVAAEPAGSERPDAWAEADALLDTPLEFDVEPAPEHTDPEDEEP